MIEVSEVLLVDAENLEEAENTIRCLLNSGTKAGKLVAIGADLALTILGLQEKEVRNDRRANS